MAGAARGSGGTDGGIERPSLQSGLELVSPGLGQREHVGDELHVHGLTARTIALTLGGVEQQLSSTTSTQQLDTGSMSHRHHERAIPRGKSNAGTIATIERSL